MVTNLWPELVPGSGPLYQRLAERLEHDIANGKLAEGDKLPPQRDLAFDIGTTVGTVGRAYALLRERGLVSGEVGRGTFVLARRPNLAVSLRESATYLSPKSGITRYDLAPACDVGQSVVLADTIAAICRDNPRFVASFGVNPDHWLEAGRIWLSRGGFEPTEDMVVVTSGSHVSLMAVVSAVTRPGDTVLFEELSTPPGARGVIELGRRVATIRIDKYGAIPEDFRAACAQQHPKLAVLTPTASCPTTSTMPVDRRTAIAEIAREFSVLLVEDDQFGRLSCDPSPLLACFAPERTFVVGGLSASVAHGLKGAWIASPPAWRDRVRIAFKLLSGGLTYLNAETSARLVLSGDAARIETRVAAQNRLTTAIASEVLAGYQFDSTPNLAALWLALPDTWNSSSFKQAVQQKGYLIDDEDEFKTGRSERLFHRVWLGLSGHTDPAELRRGVSVIRTLLDEGQAGYERLD